MIKLSTYQSSPDILFCNFFEVLLFKSLFNYFMQNKLFTHYQSGFIPGDSCVAQLLSIIHEIHQRFDWNPSMDMRGSFLNISKAVDKI